MIGDSLVQIGPIERKIIFGEMGALKHSALIDRHFCRTVGLGQLEVVLNGVEFRTRHNDYTLQMPSTTTKDYNAVEDIEFPPVPPEVLSKETVLEQIDEMREYFRGQ